MENIDFYKKLMRIQSDLKAPKGQKNAFGGYKYRSCEDILEAVKPLLRREEMILIISDEIVSVEGRVYIKATATVSDGITFMKAEALAREADTKKGMDPSQVTGATSSYARKYALNGLFCIDDTKDADTDAYTKQTQEKEKKPDFGSASKPEPQQTESDQPFNIEEPEEESAELRGLRELMKKDKITEDQVLGAFKGKFSAIENIDKKSINDLIKKWDKFIGFTKGGK